MIPEEKMILLFSCLENDDLGEIKKYINKENVNLIIIDGLTPFSYIIGT